MSNNIIKELRKLAWVEQVLPSAGSLAPVIERAVRRGTRLGIQEAITNKGLNGKEEKENVSKR